MKAAMWGVGLFVMGLFGLLLISLFGNITVTNQFDYTTMKNAVQSAMLDSLDIAHYRAGFCLCTANGSKIDKENLKVFNDKNEYEFRDLVDDKCVDQDGKTMDSCVSLYGEYRLDADKFKNEFQTRFEKVKTNNKEYEYVIKEVIEYPPKVSVRVISKDDEFIPTDKSSGGYSIVNQLDAIIETNGEIVFTSQTKHKIITHHYIVGTTTDVHDDDSLEVDEGENYKTSYYSSSQLKSEYKDKYSWDGKTPSRATGTADGSIEVIYYYKLNTGVCCYNSSTYLYDWEDDGTCQSGYEKTTVGKLQCINVCYCQKNSDYCGVWAARDDDPLWADYERVNNTNGTCQRVSTSTGSCKWHYYVKSVTCTKTVNKTTQIYGGTCQSGCTTTYLTGQLKNCTCPTIVSTMIDVGKASGRGTSSTASDAVNQCKSAMSGYCSNGYTGMGGNDCMAVRDWQCEGSDGNVYTINNVATSPGPKCKCLG